MRFQILFVVVRFQCSILTYFSILQFSPYCHNGRVTYVSFSFSGEFYIGSNICRL
jgi:hypothetical protein